jgi:hypothetical protein
LSGQSELSLLRGGANNRVFRVSDGAREAVLKQYFQNPADPRDRFRAERAFYEFLWSCGVKCTPEPLGWDEALRVGLFSFEAGRKLEPREVDGARVEEAAQFVVELNRHRARASGNMLPASEACFTIREHLACVERRVARLRGITGGEEIDREAERFVHEELEPRWTAIRAFIEREAEREGSAWAELSHNDRCLSPSDFGFHNALLTGHTLKFFDFEYAGWDDPAKLICDFFCQPELPTPKAYWGNFTSQISKAFADSLAVARRAELLYPGYQLKWCCIMLNDFVQSESNRRKFALGEESVATRKRNQLAKSVAALKAMA